MNYMDEIVKNTVFDRNKPLADSVYESLQSMIISGKIPLGERIIEKEYADKLKISRTPIREAIRRLSQEDLVLISPKIGATVRTVTEDDVVEIYEIRMQLEKLAVLKAIERVTDEEIKEIENLLDLTEETNRRGDVKEVVRLFGVFNTLIYSASGMNRLRDMISKLNEYTQRFRHISIREDERREKAIKEHRLILDAIKNKDKESVDSLIKNHLKTSLDIVLSDMKHINNKSDNQNEE